MPAERFCSRVRDGAVHPGPPVSFTFDGVAREAIAGESIAAALIANGVISLGTRRDGSPRGVWCGMGVCQECLVTVNGKTSRRACMDAIEDGDCVESQGYAIKVPLRPIAPAPSAPEIEGPQVLVVGAGPAGLAAALAASLCGATVVLLDERSQPGGQYYKQPGKSLKVVRPDQLDTQALRGRMLEQRTRTAGVAFRSQATVWGVFPPKELAVRDAAVDRVMRPARLVIATGVYERGIPMPGWTLPGYMTTGAVQGLLRTYRVLAGRRVVVAGNGPLNIQLAAELVAAGAQVVAVVELAPKSTLASVDGWRAAVSAPIVLAQGLRSLVRLRLAGVPIRYESALVAAHGAARVEACTIARFDSAGVRIPGTELRIDADLVCVGYGFLPSNEITRGLGCGHAMENGRLHTIVDADGATSVPHVYAIGDAVRLLGAHVAEAQGFVTGCAVATSLGLVVPPNVQTELERNRRKFARHCAFQHAIWNVFKGPDLSISLAESHTIVCRCECVRTKTIQQAIADGATTLGGIKRRTRAGMGRCQGRYCESLMAELLPAHLKIARGELDAMAPHAPIKPQSVEDLT